MSKQYRLIEVCSCPLSKLYDGLKFKQLENSEGYPCYEDDEGNLYTAEGILAKAIGE